MIAGGLGGGPCLRLLVQTGFVRYPVDGGKEEDWRTGECAIDSKLSKLLPADYAYSGVQAHGLQELPKELLLCLFETATEHGMAMRVVLFQVPRWSGTCAGNGVSARCHCHYEECIPSLLDGIYWEYLLGIWPRKRGDNEGRI